MIKTIEYPYIRNLNWTQLPKLSILIYRNNQVILLLFSIVIHYMYYNIQLQFYSRYIQINRQVYVEVSHFLILLHKSVETNLKFGDSFFIAALTLHSELIIMRKVLHDYYTKGLLKNQQFFISIHSKKFQKETRYLGYYHFFRI